MALLQPQEQGMEMSAFHHMAPLLMRHTIATLDMYWWIIDDGSWTHLVIHAIKVARGPRGGHLLVVKYSTCECFRCLMIGYNALYMCNNCYQNLFECLINLPSRLRHPQILLFCRLRSFEIWGLNYYHMMAILLTTRSVKLNLRWSNFNLLHVC